MKKVLVVDDERSIRVTLQEFLLREGYEVCTAENAISAMEMLQDDEYDVVVTDIILPRMSGIALIEQIRERSKTTQVILITGEPSVDTAVKAVQAGANDYIAKPISKDVLLRSVRHAMQVKFINDEKKRRENERHQHQKDLERLADERIQSLRKASEGMISLLTSIVETRDPYAAGHQSRVGNLSAAIAQRLGLDPKTVEQIRITGYIHDVGKIAVPAEILAKPGPLNVLEMEQIRSHPFYGYELIKNTNLLPMIGSAVYQHHERYDGSGYPNGLKGEEIVPEAQILMVADTVEAMLSQRPYRPKHSLACTIQELRNKSGVLYDPRIARECIALLQDEKYHIEEKVYPIRYLL